MNWLLAAVFGVGALMLPPRLDDRQHEPRGIRNHNPGNIRHGQNWQGMAAVQSDAAFITFTQPAWGLRAMARVLKNYERLHSLDTVAGIIGRWAPPIENDTGAYVAAVAHKLGVGVNERIAIDAHLPALMDAIIHHENGRQPYTRAQIEEGIARA